MVRSRVRFAGACAALVLAGGAAHAGGLTVDPVLRGGFGGGVELGDFGRAPHGAFVDVETGWARWLASDADAARSRTPLPAAPNNGWAFGASVGYQWRSGLALAARFDDLGIDSSRDGHALLCASAGVRYALPMFVMPFVEASLGAMFDGAATSPAVGLGAGAAVPVARHAIVALTVRDWIGSLDGAVRHVPSLTAGVLLGFGG